MPSFVPGSGEAHLRAYLESLVSKDRRIPDGEAKRQVVLAALRRFKDVGVTASTISDVLSEEANRMVKRLSTP